MVTKTTAQKYDDLLARLRGVPSLLVAFSGGADSTFLLAAAQKAVVGRVLAVTARSPSFPAREAEHAGVTARLLDAEHLFITSHECEDRSFLANPPDRCYYCKSGLFADLRELAARENLAAVADGTTADELQGHRPGARAGAELKILSPLADAALTKNEVRRLAREEGVPNFDRPPMACLASRFPSGEEITLAKLKVVEEAEDLLADLGFRQFRCRWHGPLARLELGPQELGRAAAAGVRKKITARLHELGFTYVTLDLDGYRSGSMHEGLSKDESGKE